MDNVLVTGGAGYIGSHTCKVLASAGYQPIAFDNMTNGHEWAVKWGPLEMGDTSDTAGVYRVLEKYSPVAVVHFAAFAYVGESVLDPQKYYSNNVAGTLGLLEAMIGSNIDKLVFSSTCATYGIPNGKTIAENHPQVPISPYGRSKLMVEQILKDFDSAYGLKSLSLRYFNAAGADPDGEIGEEHNPETHLIPQILDTAIGRRPNITIFGDNYDTPDGTCVRDYIHVTDLATAHVLALESLIRRKETDAFNLGNGTGHSVKQVIDAARTVTGTDITVVAGERRPGDPPYLVAECDRAQATLGWLPEFPDLSQIVDTAWSWHRKRFG